MLSWNAGAERLLGYRADDVVAKRSPSLTSEVEPQMEDILHRVLDRREALEFETRRRRNDGVVLDVAMTAAPILDQAGVATAIAVVARDITERKRSERDHAHTPVIALTASVFSDAVRLTRAAGCDAHVAKPVNKATLLRAIRDAVDAGRQP